MPGGRRRGTRTYGESDLVETGVRHRDRGRHVAVGDELEGQFVVTGSLVRAADAHRFVASADAGGSCRHKVMRRSGVSSELGGGAADISGGQGLGVSGVQPRPFARQQVLVDGFGDEGVSECVTVVADGNEHVRLDGRTQRSFEGVLLQPRAACE